MYRYLHTSIICISQRMHGDAASILTFSSLLMTLLTCALPSTMPREASSSEQTTSSLTALALAPGVLNTGMPSSVILGTGMLLVPAPQRTMQRTVGATSSGLRVCERSMMAMGDEGSWLSSPATAYLPDGKRLSPTGLMALNVLMVKAAPAWLPSDFPAAAEAAEASFAFALRSLVMARAFSSSATSSSS